MCRNNDDLPDNVINAKDLYYKHRLRESGIEDQKLLKLATHEGYLIITQDRKLVIRANQQNIDIVYAVGRSGWKWFYIPKEIKATNGKHLRDFINSTGEIKGKAQIISKKQTVVIDHSTIPFYMKKGVNKL